MTSRQLREAILDEDTRQVNFFNGRLLSGEDLSREQEANRQAHARLGQAIGWGVVSGMHVRLGQSGASPDVRGAVVSVSAGAAINGNGQMLQLGNDVDLSLVAEPPAASSGAGLFAGCEPPQALPDISGTGVYVLVVSPTSGFRGRATDSGLGGAGGIGGVACRSNYALEGVKFGLLWVDAANLPVSSALSTEITNLMAAGGAANNMLLRNLLAHVCFGTEDRLGFVRDPFGRTAATAPYPTYKGLDAVGSIAPITACDVPLALIYWGASGIQFVDLASVRRRPTFGQPTQPWLLAPVGGYPAVGEAISVQFQEQVAAIVQAPASQLSMMQIDAYFHYLPAAGLAPLAGSRTQPGFSYPGLFANVPHREPAYIEGALVEGLLRESLAFPPVDLRQKELLWLYKVRENGQAVDKGGTRAPQPYILFTSGHMGYRGDAHFDLSHWDYGNYAI